MPTIGIEIGETYTFNQQDRTNYYHPMGFAYGPDGAHDDEPELEPGVTLGTTGCADASTCPAPMYFTGAGYAGQYSNIAAVQNETTDETDFGLDHYEPLFFYPMREWTSLGPFSVQLRFDDDTYDKDLFYFCHVSVFFCVEALPFGKDCFACCGATNLLQTLIFVATNSRSINSCPAGSSCSRMVSQSTKPTIHQSSTSTTIHPNLIGRVERTDWKTSSSPTRNVPKRLCVGPKIKVRDFRPTRLVRTLPIVTCSQ